MRNWSFEPLNLYVIIVQLIQLVVIDFYWMFRFSLFYRFWGFIGTHGIIWFILHCDQAWIVILL